MGLDAVEFIMEIEADFSIKISDKDAAGLGVLGDLSRHIVMLSGSQNSVSLEFESVLKRVIDILVNNHGIPRQLMNSTSHLVFDLGLD